MLPLPYILNDRYRLDVIIGQGGFGTVFRSTDLKLGREVAVKLLSQQATNPSNLRRFIHEAQFSSQLNHNFTLIVLEVRW